MKKLIIKIITVSCVCFSLLLSGCGSSNENNADLVSNADLSSSKYVLGDTMGDYTVTDINGVSHNFSKILEDKKAIVLNFWFINCGPCQMEFPYLQSAYDAYKDDIEVIAINPVDKRENNIIKYAEQNELTLPMAMGEESWISAFGITGFPTTVVIDRTGTVSFMHVGAVTEGGIFDSIFRYFTADEYESKIVKNINEFM